MGFWILLALIALLVFFAISIYNRLVNLRNRVKNAFAQIDVQLTRRHDLIPNLIEAVKGYMGHERETLEAVIQARNTAVAGLKNAAADPSNAKAIQELAGAEAALTGSRKPTRISKRTRTSSSSRKNSPAPRTRWRFPARPSTMPSCSTTTRARISRITCWPVFSTSKLPSSCRSNRWKNARCQRCLSTRPSRC